MKKYQVVEINQFQEDEILQTENLEEAKGIAYRYWNYLTDKEKQNNKIEIRTDFQFDSVEDEEDGLYSGYNIVKW